MKKMIILGLALSMLIGCVTLPKIPKFEDSNAYLIRESVGKIKMSEEIKDYVDKNEKVTIVSLENSKTYDNSISSVVEDVLIKDLVDNDYFVIERDDDLLYRLMSESDTTYSYIHRYKKNSNYGSFGSSFGGGAISSGYLAGRSVSSSLRASSFNEIENFDDFKIPTKLLSADKIISYRILECGIMYEDKQEMNSFKAKVDRIANTIILYRLEDAKTGQIIATKTIKGVTKDTITKEEKDSLEKFGFTHYRFGYPQVYGNPVQQEYKGSTGKKKAIFIGGAVAIMVIGLVLSM